MLSAAVMLTLSYAAIGGDSALAVVPMRCSWEEIELGLCNDDDGDGDLEIGDTRPIENDPGRERPGSGPDVPISDPGIPAPPPGDEGPGHDDGAGWQCLDPDEAQLGNDCTIPVPDEPVPEEPEAPVIPPITIEDVAVFTPAPASPAIEPYGIAIMHAPMNVAVSASSHTVEGELFDLPMSVTFTPELYTVDYGDGTVAETSTGSPTWSELGQEQLTPTATSHAYSARGTFAVSVDVAYSATVDFGEWGVHPVNGHVVSPGRDIDVTVYEKRSLLVDQTCEEDPAGPGCGPVS
ncbi:hypothetical protein [Microbacterium sp. G2-8]|uniref:hypothetical protein n=1 Tax=Microbacterium sp. G2-8 TaxID=2842454 RepID=UPI001C8A6726|nr:hypothetical protein [Microbacterium sp. G2-8]